jgi:hypothetical protein
MESIPNSSPDANSEIYSEFAENAPPTCENACLVSSQLSYRYVSVKTVEVQN